MPPFATTTTTPNMGMVLPVPSVEVGPAWATELITAFTDILDAHDHSSGKGVRINTAGLSINADLAINGYRLGTVKTLALSSMGAALVIAPDLGTLQNVSGDLYWVNSGGSAVKITAGASLNSAALVSSVWAQVLVNTNISIAAGSTNIDHIVDTSAGRTITLPAANAVSAGRFYVIKDYTGNAATNNVTIAAAGADTIDGAASLLLKANYASVLIVSDGTSKWTPHWFQPTGPLNLSATNAVSGVLPSANMFQATTGTSGAVQLAGDLAGTSIDPLVVALTGVSGNVAMRTNTLTWDYPTTPMIGQLTAIAAGSGSVFDIVAQNGKTSGTGGIVRISGGAKAGTPLGNGGGVQLWTEMNGATPRLGIEVTYIGTVSNVALNLGGAATTAAQFGNGDGVTLIAPARTVPTTPSNGVVMYANSSKMGFQSASTHSFETDFSSASTATTGAAGAPPPQVLGYLTATRDGVTIKIPYYAA